MDRIDRLVKSIAEKQGAALAPHAIREARRTLEAAYLNSLLDGCAPFCSRTKEGSHGKAQHHRGGADAGAGQAG